MEDFGKLSGLFERPEQDINTVLSGISDRVQAVDRHIANVLGIRQPEVVLIIRRLLESYSWFLDQTIGQRDRMVIGKYERNDKSIEEQMEALNINRPETKNEQQMRQTQEVQAGDSLVKEMNDLKNCIKVKESYANDLCGNELGNQQSSSPEEMIIDKAALVVAECGNKDYGVEEVAMEWQQVLLEREREDLKVQIKSDNMESATPIVNKLGNQQLQTECSRKNRLEDSIHAPANRGKNIDINEKIGQEKQRQVKLSHKSSLDESIHARVREDSRIDSKVKQRFMQEGRLNSSALEITVWDLLDRTRIDRLRSQLERFGRAVCIREANKDFRRAAVFRVRPHDEEWRVRLLKTWAIETEEGRLLRMNIGHLNFAALKERERYRAIVRNIPKNAIDGILLRQLQRVNAKNVFIRRNSNGNYSSVAIVDFASREDKEVALRQTVYYRDTKLKWDIESYLTGSNAIPLPEQGHKKRREENWRKRKYRDIVDIDSVERVDYENRRRGRFKRRRLEGYRVENDYNGLRRQLRDLEYRGNWQTYYNYNNRQVNPVWRS